MTRNFLALSLAGALALGVSLVLLWPQADVLQPGAERVVAPAEPLTPAVPPVPSAADTIAAPDAQRSANAGAAPPATADTAGAPPAPRIVETVKIRKRDTVIAALLRHDVPSSTAHALVATLRSAGADLRRVRPGDLLELSRDADRQVLSLAYAPTPWTRFELSASDGEWTAVRNDVEPEVRIEAHQGEVRRSLWDAVDGGIVSADVLLDLIRIFESVFDFSADTQPGDRFRLLVESRYANGKAVDHGRIVAAQYQSEGRVLTAVGFKVKQRFAYYDLEGRSLKRAFLRSPLQFTRISSGYTYRRPHPVLGGVRPHLAIDYAAPTGTPVWAVADGVVQFAGRKGGNGIQVMLRHARGYATYYNHLSRIARGVRRGSRVSQKQVIGYVGSTGLSTGPHLDYRVSHNGRFVNPLSERFLPGDPVAKAQRAQFRQRADELVGRMEREMPFGSGAG